jgi:hypothetical protein
VIHWEPSFDMMEMNARRCREEVIVELETRSPRDGA